MIKYTRNKNFIPQEFIIKRKIAMRKKCSKFLMICILMNLFLLPQSIKKIRTYNKKEIPVAYIKRGRSINEIKKWFKIVSLSKIREANIKDNEGVIILEDFDTFYKLELDKEIDLISLDIIGEECHINVEGY